MIYRLNSERSAIVHKAIYLLKNNTDLIKKTLIPLIFDYNLISYETSMSISLTKSN